MYFDLDSAILLIEIIQFSEYILDSTIRIITEKSILSGGTTKKQKKIFYICIMRKNEKVPEASSVRGEKAVTSDATLVDNFLQWMQNLLSTKIMSQEEYLDSLFNITSDDMYKHKRLANITFTCKMLSFPCM